MAEEQKTTEVTMEQTPETGADTEVPTVQEAVSEPAGEPVDKTAAAAPKAKKRRTRNQVLKGRANIQCTYNNTIVTLSDQNGAVLAWSSSGHMGFKGAKKSTPYAATQVVAEVTEKVKKYGLQELEVFVKGVGSGREASIRALANNGFILTALHDVTPIPHNGCRPRRPRRV